VLFRSFVNNSIESISKVQSNGAIVTTYENIGKNQRFRLNLYLRYNPDQKVSIYFNGNGNYSKLESNNGYTITNEGFSYSGSLGGRWTLWKDGSVNMNCGIYAPSIMLQGKSSPFYYTSLGVSQYMMKRKLMLSLSVRDPFWHKEKYTSESKDITFSTHNVSTELTRTVRFNLTYNFGKMDLQVKKANRGIDNDDVKGGGKSQGGENQ
jgi:hypothetical protein